MGQVLQCVMMGNSREKIPDVMELVNNSANPSRIFYNKQGKAVSALRTYIDNSTLEDLM